MTARARLVTVLGILALSGLVLLGTISTWLTVTLRTEDAHVDVLGSDAAPLLAPVALASLALGLALTIVGAVMRWILLVLGAILGAVGAVLSFTIAIARPVESFAQSVTDVTGITGAESVAEVATSVTVTVWPWIAGIASVLVVAVCGFGMATATGWKRAGRRFEAETTPRPDDVPRDSIDAWDDLSRGDDPTR